MADVQLVDRTVVLAVKRPDGGFLEVNCATTDVAVSHWKSSYGDQPGFIRGQDRGTIRFLNPGDKDPE